jgi:pyruvate/2-oxoglutarate dehydrogenase complex dihydrolipoamide acyltransferase (E2) component
MACPKCGLQFSQPVGGQVPQQGPIPPQYNYPPQGGYPPQGPIAPQKSSPIQNGCLISACILFCFPLGLVFLWINPKYSTKFKAIVTGSIALLLIVSGIYNASPAGQPQAAIQAQQQAAQDAAADAQAAKQKEESIPHVSVDTIAAAYAANEIAANNKYDNQELILKGTVGDIRTAIGGQSYVSLQGSTPADTLLPNEVTCYFSDDLSNQLAALQKGDSIEVDGTCEGEPVGMVDMNGCTIKQ